jgi:hypothetical protein
MRFQHDGGKVQVFGAFVAMPLSIAGVVAMRHFLPDEEIDLSG